MSSLKKIKINIATDLLPLAFSIPKMESSNEKNQGKVNNAFYSTMDCMRYVVASGKTCYVEILTQMDLKVKFENPIIQMLIMVIT